MTTLVLPTISLAQSYLLSHVVSWARKLSFAESLDKKHHTEEQLLSLEDPSFQAFEALFGQCFRMQEQTSEVPKPVVKITKKITLPYYFF